MLTPEVYSTIARRQLDLTDYIDVVRRHRAWIFGPVFFGVVLATVIAFALPNTYVSQATLRITPSQISETILPSIVTQQMVDRLNQMQQDILSRTSLAELIQRPTLDLYKRERDRKPLDDVIEEMRAKDVRVQLAASGGPSAPGRPASAFTISFAYSDRRKAKAVVDALVTKFVEANLSVQRVHSSMTADFLHDEVARAKSEVDLLNNELTDFREKNAGRLPEQLQMNLTAMAALQSQRSSLDEALNRDSQEKLIWESKLDSLRGQRDTYTTLAQSTEDPAQKENTESLRELNHLIDQSEIQLAAAKERYTETHPDVKNLEATLTSLKKQRDEAQKREEAATAAADKKQGPLSKRTNAVLAVQLNDIAAQENQTRSQLKALELDRQTRLKQLEDVNQQIQRFQSRLESGPANQQRYVQLAADEQVAQQRYQDLIRKQSLSDETQQAEVRKATENLEVLDAASDPISPTAPNRFLIVGIGFGAGLVAGLGLVALREVKDTSLKNLKDVRAYTQLPILSSIPLLENDLLVQRRRRVTYVSWSAGVILGMLAVSASLYYHFFVYSS